MKGGYGDAVVATMAVGVMWFSVYVSHSEGEKLGAVPGERKGLWASFDNLRSFL